MPEPRIRYFVESYNGRLWNVMKYADGKYIDTMCTCKNLEYATKIAIALDTCPVD